MKSPSLKNGTSTGEQSTLDYFKRLFKTDFVKVRPTWLKNPKTGRCLELDGYSEKLKIAFEYGSHKMAHKHSMIFTDQKNVKYKDAVKKRVCKKKGIKLIQIPDLKFDRKSFNETFKSIVLSEFKRLSIKVPYSFCDTNLVVKEIPFAYSVKDVWLKAKSCKNRSQFERQHKGYWRAAERLGIIKEVVAYFRTISLKRDPVTPTEIKVDALKCKTRSEFSKKFRASYKKAIQLKILDEVCSHMKSKQVPWKYWDRNALSALSKVTHKSEVRKNLGLLHAVMRNPETKKIYNNLIDKKDRGWTKKKCKDNALKFSTVSDWKYSKGSSLKTAVKKGWYSDCTRHMKKSKAGKIVSLAS